MAQGNQIIVPTYVRPWALDRAEPLVAPVCRAEPSRTPAGTVSVVRISAREHRTSGACRPSRSGRGTPRSGHRTGAKPDPQTPGRGNRARRGGSRPRDAQCRGTTGPQQADATRPGPRSYRRRTATRKPCVRTAEDASTCPALGAGSAVATPGVSLQTQSRASPVRQCRICSWLAGLSAAQAATRLLSVARLTRTPDRSCHRGPNSRSGGEPDRDLLVGAPNDRIESCARQGTGYRRWLRRTSRRCCGPPPSRSPRTPTSPCCPCSGRTGVGATVLAG